MQRRRKEDTFQHMTKGNGIGDLLIIIIFHLTKTVGYLADIPRLHLHQRIKSINTNDIMFLTTDNIGRHRSGRINISRQNPFSH